MKDNHKNNTLERFVIVTFASLLVVILAIAGVLAVLGLQQLNRSHPLESFSGEEIIVTSVAITQEAAFFPWDEQYQIQIGTLEGENGWLTVSKGDYRGGVSRPSRRAARSLVTP